MTRKEFESLAIQYGQSVSKYFWGECGNATVFAFDLCFALWVYSNLYNEDTPIINGIRSALREVRFFPGTGVTETDILEDTSGEYSTAQCIYYDVLINPALYLDALLTYHRETEK